MRDLFKKFSEIEADISREKGAFALFGLFQRETSLPDSWDVVISASWLGEDEVATLNYLFGKFREKLTADEMVMISMVLLLKPSEPFVREIATSVKSENGKTIVSNYGFDGMVITQGVIIAPKQVTKKKVIKAANLISAQ